MKMELNITTIGLILLTGIAAGMISSLVGIGGGIIVVPALVLIIGMDQKTAQGTSLAMLSLPVAFAAAFNYYKGGYVNWKIALMLAATFVIGGFFGSKIAIGLEASVLKKIFAVVMLVLGVKYLFFDK
jgi:uncharacterized membrane protein YfcA